MGASSRLCDCQRIHDVPARHDGIAFHMTTFTPTTAAEVLAAVQWAAGEGEPLEIVGQGSKRGIGQFFREVGFTMPAFTEVKLQILGQGGVAFVVAGRLIHDCLLAPTGLSLVPSTLGKTVVPTAQALWHHL